MIWILFDDGGALRRRAERKNMFPKVALSEHELIRSKGLLLALYMGLNLKTKSFMLSRFLAQTSSCTTGTSKQVPQPTIDTWSDCRLQPLVAQLKSWLYLVDCGHTYGHSLGHPVVANLIGVVVGAETWSLVFTKQIRICTVRRQHFKRDTLIETLA